MGPQARHDGNLRHASRHLQHLQKILDALNLLSPSPFCVLPVRLQVSREAAQVDIACPVEDRAGQSKGSRARSLRNIAHVGGRVAFPVQCSSCYLYLGYYCWLDWSWRSWTWRRGPSSCGCSEPHFQVSVLCEKFLNLFDEGCILLKGDCQSVSP